MNMDRLIPPKGCDLAYWLSSVVWDAIRDARDAGMSDTDAAVLLDCIARACARQAGRPTHFYIGTRSSDPPDIFDELIAAATAARGELLPQVETRCVGFGEDECAGWPRWILLDAGWVGDLAFSLDDEDDESVDGYYRDWMCKAIADDAEDDDEPSCQPWEMYPERFADPRTWCGAELP
jgi:hypothetical protein